jgi:uncharacterized RDD family membrane protein YckC
MIYRMPTPPDELLTEGVMSRRVAAWFIDALLIGLLVAVLWFILFLFGLLTLGLGFGALGILPFVPFAYSVLWLLSSASATPGQRMFGLTVRRDDDLGPPTLLQALIFTLIYDLTLAFTGLLLLVALFTTRHRTLHDMASGLVVVRARRLDMLTPPPPYGNMPYA